MECIKSRQNPKIQRVKKLGTDRAFRRREGAFVCDGEKLLYEAVKNGAEIEAVYSADENADFGGYTGPVYTVAQELMEYMSPVKTPQNVIFTCRVRPVPEKKADKIRYVLLEGVQDPGNLGTIIRTANALNYGKVLLLPGCADLYNPKTIRATMGAVFRQCVEETGYDSVSELVSTGISLYGAALREDSTDIRETEFENFIIAIGSEGQGLTEKLLHMCTGKIIIPMNPECESFNASLAAGIIMWEAVREGGCL